MAALSEQALSTRLGEVIETSSAGFVSESDNLHQLPELGALVSVGGMDASRVYFGVVSWGATGGLDASRKAIRRGGDDLADAAIFERHPELELILRTVFGVTVIGYRDGSIARHLPPPLPVPLHYSVHACDPVTVRHFCAGPGYLSALLNAQGQIIPEQLLAAHLRWVDSRLADNHDWLADATRRVARLMKRDYDRLVTILEAVDPD